MIFSQLCISLLLLRFLWMSGGIRWDDSDYWTPKEFNIIKIIVSGIGICAMLAESCLWVISNCKSGVDFEYLALSVFVGSFVLQMCVCMGILPFCAKIKKKKFLRQIAQSTVYDNLEKPIEKLVPICEKNARKTRSRICFYQADVYEACKDVKDQIQKEKSISTNNLK